MQRYIARYQEVERYQVVLRDIATFQDEGDRRMLENVTDVERGCEMAMDVEICSKVSRDFEQWQTFVDIGR